MRGAARTSQSLAAPLIRDDFFGLNFRLSMRQQPQQTGQCQMQHEVNDQRDNIGNPKPKAPGRRVRKQALERRQQWRIDRRDELPEGIALIGTCQIEQDLKADHPVNDVENVIEKL